jgi:uncharacterized protein DUF6519
MPFDNSRFPFNPWKDYCGVVELQGRVHLESEWNEWLAEINRRFQAGTLDAQGAVFCPATTPWAFKIAASSDATGNHLTIGPGRMYVDGILAENHGDAASAQWDPALAELSGSPQPPPTAEPAGLDFTQQPYFPNAAIPAGDGPFLAYLDVWRRAVTYLEDPDIIDKAVGVDTSGRLQTVWQVKLLDLSNSGGNVNCTSSIPDWDALIQPSAGQLTTGVVQSTPSGPCCLSPNTGYTGMENQFYRVEIHHGGALVASPQAPTEYPLATGSGTGTFKWSRENGSVETGVTGIANVTNTAGNPASGLTVMSMGRDQVLGFAPGNWIEILDDELELAGLPGELHLIDSVDFAAKVIVLDSTVSASSFPATAGQTDPARHTRIRRWDQSGKIYESDGVTVWCDLGAAGATGDIPIPPPGTTLILENGVTVTFDLNPPSGKFRPGDFWTFAARTADGSVEALTHSYPRGVHHHYVRLSVVTFPNGATDCRPTVPTGGAGECGCCCSCTVGDGVESVGKFTSIQAAVDSLPAEGGEVCILPGRYFQTVKIVGRRDIVIHGCGWRTRVASASLGPIEFRPAAAAAAAGFGAVIEIESSRHIELRSFVVEAADGDAGILINRTGISAPATPAGNVRAAVFIPQGVVDVTIEEMVITASTMPAILARRVELLRIDDNRIAVNDVRSTAPAVYVSGTEIHIDRNWIGVLNRRTVGEWLPAIVAADLRDSLSAAMNSTSSAFAALHPGGIQIGGPSNDVYVTENEIEGGSRNGVTLGSFDILDTNGKNTGQWVGVLVIPEDDCSTSGTVVVSGTNPGPGGGRVVSSGNLVNIHIHRNRIRNMGLCGIGPVGFFDLLETLEIITIRGLNISQNGITRTVMRAIAPLDPKQTSFAGYGAICVPDVADLVIRDNTITDFGATPGLAVCGILVVHGEMLEISRNKVTETRDWAQAPQQIASPAGIKGGITVLLATPPSFPGTPTLSAASTYEPGLPALRVEHNVVRVPIGQALLAIGTGPFSIVNNHFSSGGTVQGSGTPIAQTVLVMNAGKAIESAGLAVKPSAVFSGAKTSNANFGTAPSAVSTDVSSGAILFTNNICQLEARLANEHEDASVFIFTPDHLTFSSNHCWVDGARLGAFTDALLLAGTLNVTGNRFQEARNFPVLFSGLTAGSFNITSQNISTYCLLALGPNLINNSNLCLVPQPICSRLLEVLSAK